MGRITKHKKRRWMTNPAKILGAIFALSILVGLGIAVSSTTIPTRLQIVAKSGCNIVSTKDGPGCLCAEGGWQWHCGGSECSSAQQQECLAENGSQQVTSKNEATKKTRCKLGDWACGTHCADATVQKIFNSTWKDGKAQWLLEAGCGGNGGSGKKSDAGVVANSTDLCSSNSVTSIGCQGKSVGTVVGLSGGRSCVCAFTTKPDCACLVSAQPTKASPWTNPELKYLSWSTPIPTRMKLGMKREAVSPTPEYGIVGDATASVNCSTDYFTHSSCRGKVSGSSCIDDGWFSAPKNGFCEKVGNGNRCECNTSMQNTTNTDTTVKRDQAVVPTSPSKLAKDGSQQNIDKGAESDAQQNNSTQKCSHNFWTASSCRGEAVGTICQYTQGWLRSKTIHGGTCRQSGWSGCSCE